MRDLAAAIFCILLSLGICYLLAPDAVEHMLRAIL